MCSYVSGYVCVSGSLKCLGNLYFVILAIQFLLKNTLFYKNIIFFFVNIHSVIFIWEHVIP